MDMTIQQKILQTNVILLQENMRTINKKENGMLDDILKDYKFGRCKTVKEVFEDIIDDVLNEIDNVLLELEDDVESGKFSNDEIGERIKELRAKIY